MAGPSGLVDNGEAATRQRIIDQRLPNERTDLMDELRWFLLIAGLVVIAAVFFYGRVQEWRQEGLPWSRRRREDRAPFREEELNDDDLRGALGELDTLISEQQTEIRPPATAEPREYDRPPAGPRSLRRGSDAPGPDFTGERTGERGREPPAEANTGEEAAPRTESPAPEHHTSSGHAPDRGRAEPRRPARRPRLATVRSRLRGVFSGARDEPTPAPADPAAPPPPSGEEKVVVLNVMAPDGTRFAGPAVVEALHAVGLRHGEHGIFHRTLETRTGTVALYSAANVLKPGWFDLDAIDDLETPGVVFFLQLPGPFNGLAAFEQMLQAARGLGQGLGGHLLDGRRCDLTQQSIEHVREELLEYRRRAHLAARHAR